MMLSVPGYSWFLLRFNSEYCMSFLETANNKKVFRFWQRGGGFDRNLFNPEAFHASIRYIESNPVRANLTSQANEYRWSSAWLSDSFKIWRPEIDRKSIPVKMVNRV